MKFAFYLCEAALTAMAEEKMRAGTARSFSMDLDGKQDPDAPQEIQEAGGEPPIERRNRASAPGSTKPTGWAA